MVLRRALRSPALPWAVTGLLLIATVVFATLWQSELADRERRAEVESTAASFLRALTNFSAQTIDWDVARIRSFAVGRFADEVGETFSPQRVEAIRQQSATSEGRIESLYVQGIGDDTATVFAVVAETVTNEQVESPRADTLRIELGMIETANAWKVERLTLLQTPATTPPV